MSFDFPGKDLLLEQIHQAVDNDGPETITNALRECLPGLIQNPEVRLPACVFDCSDDHYCRRMLHQDKELGYTVLAMTWGPSQSTPVHDHAGMWCVEGVWHGEIEVVQFELTERDNDRYRLEPRTTMRTGVGSAGSLIPPHEYHNISNPNPDQPAVTLHIYAGFMDECCVYKPLGGDWYRREPKSLALDAA